MKAALQSQPAAPAPRTAASQPAGATQLRVDESNRQGEQRRYLGRLHGGARHGGLPAQLRSGIESLSGLDMSDVRVHRNSDKPAHLQAAAYAQGQYIHLGPGQEQHLPHEAWHVVQQRQGRVRPQTSIAGVPVNEEASLEREADIMGQRATGPVQRVRADAVTLRRQPAASNAPAQLGRREAGYYGRDGKKKSQKVIRMEEFGDRNRVHNIDPDKLGETLPGEDIAGMGIEETDIDKKVGIWRPSKAEGTARPEDPPIYQPFRKAFHEAHNIKLSLERDMEQFEDLDAREQYTATLLRIASDVKVESLKYKAGVRNFGGNPIDSLKETYFLAMATLAHQASELSQKMLADYAAQSGLAEQDLGPELMTGLRAEQGRKGAEIWKTRWWAAIQEINALLLALWEQHKPQIQSWVSDKRGEGLAYMKPDMVGDLDYIGSLAKGYKSAPKQYIRFMPEKFDVDANLDAPPLAVFSISLGEQVDRGSVKSRGIDPLVAFEAAVNQALFHFDAELPKPVAAKVPGLDKDDPFEVFIRASNVTDLMFGSHPDVNLAHRQEAFSNRLQNIQDRIWWLRSRNPVLSGQLAQMLDLKGYVTPSGTIKPHDPGAGRTRPDKRTYIDFDLTLIEVALKNFEQKADEAEEAEAEEAAQVLASLSNGQ